MVILPASVRFRRPLAKHTPGDLPPQRPTASRHTVFPRQPRNQLQSERLCPSEVTTSIAFPQAIGWQPQQAPGAVPVNCERTCIEQTALYRLTQHTVAFIAETRVVIGKSKRQGRLKNLSSATARRSGSQRQTRRHSTTNTHTQGTNRWQLQIRFGTSDDCYH